MLGGDPHHGRFAKILVSGKVLAATGHACLERACVGNLLGNRSFLTMAWPTGLKFLRHHAEGARGRRSHGFFGRPRAPPGGLVLSGFTASAARSGSPWPLMVTPARRRPSFRAGKRTSWPESWVAVAEARRWCAQAPQGRRAPSPRPSKIDAAADRGALGKQSAATRSAGRLNLRAASAPLITVQSITTRCEVTPDHSTKVTTMRRRALGGYRLQHALWSVTTRHIALALQLELG